MTRYLFGGFLLYQGVGLAVALINYQMFIDVFYATLEQLR